MTQTDPWPQADELDAAYASWYRPEAGRFSGLGDSVLRWTRGRLARRVDRVAPPGDVLDVGAGDGALLDALARRGRGALGLERSAARADMRDQSVHEVDGPWAAVVFWHSLEHLTTPAEDLRRAASMLLPGGVLIVAIPNAASLQAALFGDRWFALDIPRHLTHIPAPALESRLRDSGLVVERVSSWRGGQVVFGWLHGLIGLVPGHPDLYDAIRRPEARSAPMPRRVRRTALALVPLCAPLALLAAGFEVVAGRGGTVYMEARRA